MYMGELAQVGERFMLYAEKGRTVNCPPGTTEESSGRMGTGQKYVKCYRPPVFAPPPTTTFTYAPVTTTKVPTVITTAISPQISPTMAQQQASPGAAVTAQPVSAPGPTTGAIPTGISAGDLQRILAARDAADAAEREAEERKRQTEIETMRREIALRDRATQEIELARRADEARRIDADRFAREQADAAAAASAEALPPPPSTTYMPTGGGAFPAAMPGPMLPPPEMAIEARDVTITQDGEPVPWALIAIAAAGIGAVVLVGGKAGKRKRSKK